MPLEKDLFVKESGIHGKGIFTSIAIKAETEILVIKGEVISESECVRREEDENNVYIFWNGDNYIDVSNTEKIKYINHSCSFNCEVQDRDDESLWLVASNDIKAGEELVIDYGYDEIYESCTCDVCLIGEDEEQ
ncbi:MAG: SET domain-containing protein-lysine N-methyltransferase [Ignavibacteriaceae bacterium]|jgi:hypothetical protein